MTAAAHLVFAFKLDHHHILADSLSNPIVILALYRQRYGECPGHDSLDGHSVSKMFMLSRCPGLFKIPLNCGKRLFPGV